MEDKTLTKLLQDGFENSFASNQTIIRKTSIETEESGDTRGLYCVTSNASKTDYCLTKRFKESKLIEDNKEKSYAIFKFDGKLYKFEFERKPMQGVQRVNKVSYIGDENE